MCVYAFNNCSYKTDAVPVEGLPATWQLNHVEAETGSSSSHLQPAVVKAPLGRTIQLSSSDSDGSDDYIIPEAPWAGPPSGQNKSTDATSTNKNRDGDVIHYINQEQVTKNSSKPRKKRQTALTDTSGYLIPKVESSKRRKERRQSEQPYLNLALDNTMDTTEDYDYASFGDRTMMSPASHSAPASNTVSDSTQASGIYVNVPKKDAGSENTFHVYNNVYLKMNRAQSNLSVYKKTKNLLDKINNSQSK